MGGDGGVIATQRAFARGVGKKDDKAREARNVHLDQATRASQCALTNEPLREPIVCCELGNLYNKEAILACLLEKTLPNELQHIRGLKDLKTLRFTRNAGPSGSASSSSSSSSSSSAENASSAFVCPVTKDEFNGLHPFVAIWSTGFVLSEKAVREIGYEGLQEEYGPFTADNLIKLNPLESDMDSVRAQMHHRRELRAANAKPSKKRKVDEAVDGPSTSSKRKAESSEQTNVPAVAPPKISKSGVLVNAAQQSVEEHSKRSEVFKNLFHKDHEKDKKDRDLFMTVAGIRYTLG